MIELSVIIVGYKKLDIIIDCLNSINKFNDIGDKLEIIVIDNSPTEDIYNFLLNNYPNVKCIKNENRGFGQGNNVGARISKGKYLLFLNPDTILVESIFKYSLEKFENDNELAMFGLKLVDINLKSNASFYFMDKHGLLFGRLINLCNKLNIYIDGKMFTSGANIFIRKDDFEKSGMFDENIFMYCEELDLFRRIKSLGKKTSYFKNKKIIHLEGKTTTNSQAALKRRLESSRYYCEKYNINFKKQLKSEIRLNFIKMVIYKFLNANKSKQFKKNIEIINSFFLK